jgi:hypothetical protein
LRIYRPAILQQGKEKVWAKTDAGMTDNPYLITRGYRAFSQRGRSGREMAIYADITGMLDQHFQPARTAILYAKQLS